MASPPPLEKSFEKCIDTGSRNLVSRAPGSETDEGFSPVGSFVCQDLITTKTNEITGRERTQQSNVSTQSTQNISFMRTRSGSLAAVSARVPSHPAYPGSFTLTQVQSAINTPDPGPRPVSNTADGQMPWQGIARGHSIQHLVLMRS